MTFAVPAEAYDRFMGRFSTPLAGVFADWVRVRAGQRVLDVGCGPGALTAELVGRLGAANVCAVDPSTSFVAAARRRCDGVDIREAAAEALPFDDAAFDVSMAQLVVHFMKDPLTGLTEMRRVTTSGGQVAACVWDHAGGRGPLSVFWEAVHEVDPTAPDESHLAGARRGHLAELFASAGLLEVEESSVSVSVEFESFDEWWEPFTFGVGPAGAYVSGLDDQQRARLRDEAAKKLPAANFTVDVYAWAARGRG